MWRCCDDGGVGGHDHAIDGNSWDTTRGIFRTRTTAGSRLRRDTRYGARVLILWKNDRSGALAPATISVWRSSAGWVGNSSMQRFTSWWRLDYRATTNSSGGGCYSYSCL